MTKRAILFIVLLAVFMRPCDSINAVSVKFSYPIDVSGKILNKDGSPFAGLVEVKICVTNNYLDFGNSNSDMTHSECKTYMVTAQGGVFSWKGEGSSVTIEAVKEGYHSTRVDVYDTGPMSEGEKQVIEEAREKGEGLSAELFEKVARFKSIKNSEILIYLIQKGTPSTLQLTEHAYIPGKKDEESGGKRCGWSFSRKWYYPIDGDVPVDIIRGPNEKNKRTYTIEEPGGFIYFEGYPVFETEKKGVYPYASFSLMTEAPESGYVPFFTPVEHKPTFRGNSYFCYFKTPDGKYGKICFEGEFSYYINPEGSRNLEAGEVEEWDPINPIEADRHKR